jgi:hypothetical protein
MAAATMIFMPKVTYYKPNRSHPRHFTVKDLSRIAGYVERDSGMSKIKIVAAVASALGVGVLLCKAARITQHYFSLMKIVHQIVTILATSTALRLLIEYLKQSPIIVIPWVRWVMIALIALDGLANGILSIINDEIGTLNDVDNITDALDEACQYVDEIAGTAYEKTDDATNGRISDAIDTFKDTIDSVYLV